jgi:putative heme-binding domain-containing protein
MTPARFVPPGSQIAGLLDALAGCATRVEHLGRLASRFRGQFIVITILVGVGIALAVMLRGRPSGLKLAPGWKAELVAEAPTIRFPTAIVAASDGTIYLGQDPMDMPGPPTTPADSVLAIRGKQVTIFADGLHAVMGLEWCDGVLYVVHAPYLSAFRDTDGDAKADERTDLVTGLGPEVPAFNGINDHIAAGLRLGIDGFLYLAVGDKGVPKGVGRDGATIQMQGGGVIRVRPDGTGLEVVSTGERNPLSVALDARDEIFTYGNDDDRKKWPNSLTHHIVGGHFGYPYEFLSAPDKALPIVEGRIGGAGAQGLCYNEDGLATMFHGNLFFCDWGLGAVIRYDLMRTGSTFSVKSKEYIVRKGTLSGFRPFSLAVGDHGSCLYLVDWGFDGFLVDGPTTGRLFRLTYTGRDRTLPSPRPPNNDLNSGLAALDHPALSVRLDAQRSLVRGGRECECALAAMLRSPGRIRGRVHALWALDAIGTQDARLAIRHALGDSDAELRAQATRSAGIRRDGWARGALTNLLGDASPVVRREAAIALGRIGDQFAVAALLASLGDPDPGAAWSVRRAIRLLGTDDVAGLARVLCDPDRRVGALKLCDEWWSASSVRALAGAMRESADPAWRARLTTTLAGLYRRFPEWSGRWWGPNPLAGDAPRKTRDWDPASMAVVFDGLASALEDDDASVRREAIGGLIGVGARGLDRLREHFCRETDTANLAILARAMGNLGDRSAIPNLTRLLLEERCALEVKESAIEALSVLGGSEARAARLKLARNPETPPALIAEAIDAPGNCRLAASDLRDFLAHSHPAVRMSALRALADGRTPPDEINRKILVRLDDGFAEVRVAAIRAVASLHITAAIPKLIALAGNDSTRPDAIRALAALPDPRALEVYLNALSDRDPELRLAGEAGVRAIRNQAEVELRAQLRSRRLSESASVFLESALARFSPVVDWKVIGPFPANTPRKFDEPTAIDFGKPILGAGGRVVCWAKRHADSSNGRVLLADLCTGENQKAESGYEASRSPGLAAFAYAEVVSDRDRNAYLRIGSSGTITVACDGKPVCHFDHDSGRPYAPDSDMICVGLRNGTNRIVVESRQGIGAWSFGLQISEASSSTLAPRAVVAGSSRDRLRAYAFTHTGDAKRGEALFFDRDGIGCWRCHSAGGRGTATIGPDLTGLSASFDKPEIVRSVLEPSSRVAEGYQPLVVAKTDGTVVTGLVRGETEAHVDLMGTDLKPARIAKTDIEVRRVGEASLMPTGLVDPLTPAEFADLIAYLESLRR